MEVPPPYLPKANTAEEWAAPEDHAEVRSEEPVVGMNHDSRTFAEYSLGVLLFAQRVSTIVVSQPLQPNVSLAQDIDASTAHIGDCR